MGSRKKLPSSADQCTCTLHHPNVSQDHAKTCPLYRQRGSGVSVLNGPRANGNGNGGLQVD